MRRPWPAVLAALLCVLALLASARALQVRSRSSTQVVTVTSAPSMVAARPGANDLGTYDCPGDEACPATTVPASFVARVRAGLPGAAVVDAVAERRTDPDTGRPAALVRQAVTVRDADGVQVRVESRCVVHGSAVPTRIPSDVPSRGPAQVIVVVGAPTPGCSVVVIADVPGAVSVPLAGITALATDASLQLPG